MHADQPPAAVGLVASAGGVEALRSFVSLLPADFPAAVLTVLHISPTGPSLLPRILARAGKLPARHPDDGEPLTAGVITVAPPDRHLVAEDGRVRLIAGPHENGHRSSGDVLLRSIALSRGGRGAGVVLSGTMDDGAAGLRAVSLAGGLAMVQDPSEAFFPGMPRAAIEENHDATVGTIECLTRRLCEWTAQLPDEDPSRHGRPDPLAPFTHPGHATRLTCPECGGALRRLDTPGERYRCWVGHAFSAQSLSRGKRDAMEKALWAAVVALEEQAELARRMIERLSETGRSSQVQRYRDDIARSGRRAALITSLIRELVEQSATDYEEADRARSATG